MGKPVSCEYAEPNGTGDTLQDTTAGLAFWRKSTNTPTFTDGWNHWALTGSGLVASTGPGIDPPATALTPAQHWTPPARAKTVDCVRLGGLPDAECTPGAIDPAVTQDNIQQTICVANYTARVRPPTSFTTLLKCVLMGAYSVASLPVLDYDLDHSLS